MPEWVVAISIGPVGGFIGGGRRSRDLWWGSTWVSECTLAAARVFPPDGLIVPRRDRVRELLDRAGEASLRYGGRISNHVLARVEAESVENVVELLRASESAVHRHLATQLRGARRSVEARGGRARDAIGTVLDSGFFDKQVEAVEGGEFAEFFAAWTPRGASLASSIRRVRELLDARKTARLFTAPQSTRAGRRKSDLDPGRDSVLEPSQAGGDPASPRTAERQLARRRLGIGPDEELDAVGLARRIAVFQREGNAAGPGLGRLPFPPVTRTAADPWLRRVAGNPETRPILESIKKSLRKAAAQDDEIFFTWCSPALDPEVAWEERESLPDCFPFDASLLMEDGLEALHGEIDRIGRRLHDRREVEGTLRLIEELTPDVRALHRVHGTPPPYFALLFMDGDGVGRALADMADDVALGDLVGQLDQYAEDAEPLLRRHHFGRAFYLGGDDLAAYLPVDQALGAAMALADHFHKVVRPGGRSLTLSGGIVIGHAKADLRALRRRAQAALSAAKKARARAARSDGEIEDGWLQIVELPRSGSARSCTGPLLELATRMLGWQALLAKGALSLRSPRLLLGLHERFADAREDNGGSLGIELARHRIRAQGERSSKPKAGAEDLAVQEHVERIQCWREAEGLAYELAIAARFHRIASLRPAAEGKVQ